MRRSFTICAIFFFILVFTSGGMITGLSETLSVCHAGCKYPTVQTATSQAFAGDTIKIGPGTYEATLTINKDLTLTASRGDEVTIIPSKKGTKIFRIGPSDAKVKIENITIAGGKIGISALGEASIELNYCKIMANEETGLVLSDNSKGFFHKLTISENNSEGILLKDNSKSKIVNSIIRYNPDGIIMEDQSQAEIDHCKVSKNQLNGILMWENSSLNIINSIIRESQVYGIALASEFCKFRESEKKFIGIIQGKENFFEDNAEEPYCPPELSFLEKEEGGKYEVGDKEN